MELGYGISMDNLVPLYKRHVDGAGDVGHADAAVQVLATRSGVSLGQVLYGPHSFGSFLSARSKGAAIGFPSAQSPPPGSALRYFRGAYTTVHYTQHYADVSATQLELPYKWRSRDATVLQMYAAYLADAISDFVHAWLIRSPTAKDDDALTGKSVL